MLNTEPLNTPTKRRREKARRKRTARPALQLPAHMATTRDACVLYPGVGSSPTGPRGPFLGTDSISGGSPFHFDVIETYGIGGIINNTNAFVLGEPGNGKSALIKTLIWRSLAIYGSDRRFFCLVDVKGEYRTLAKAANFLILDLKPGGTTKINPLGRLEGTDENAVAQCVRSRTTMIEALCSTVMEHDLTQHQRTIIAVIVEQLTQLELETTGQTSRLSTVAELLRKPTPLVLEAIYEQPDTDISEHTIPLLLAIDMLLHRSLKGMFDGDTAIDLDPAVNRGLVIDLSAVSDDPNALPLIMVAATSWLQALMRAQWKDVKKVQIIDEAWILLRHLPIIKYLQEMWKLGRSFGFANIAILHRTSDLLSHADKGDEAAQLCLGLLKDTDTVVSYRQNLEELAEYEGYVGWSEDEVRIIDSLDRGQSLWRLGKRQVLLQHVINPGPESKLCDTDERLAF